MEIEDLFDAHSGKPSRTERRVRFNDDQLKRLDDIEHRLGIPFAALIRISVDCFLPKLTNMNFKEEGIKNLWNDKK